jgi:integrase
MPRSVPMSEALAEYQNHLLARDLSANTVKNNCQPIRKALAIWGDIQVASVTPRHVDKLFQQGSWQPSTRNLYLGQLRMFFAWCRRHGYLGRDIDPTDGWRNMRVPRRERMRLNVNQFADLLNACEHPRDRMVCALGLFTFMRGSEMQTLRIRDLDLDSNMVRMYRHKTREEDVLPISTELHVEATRWLNWVQHDTSSVLNPDWFLVPAKGPNPTEYSQRLHRIVHVPGVASIKPDVMLTHPYRCVQRPLSVLGFPTRVEGGHTLRRSGARALFDELREQGYDGALMRVSSMLGHRDTRITEHYIGLGLERTQRNEMLAGKPMFPSVQQPAVVLQFRRDSHGNSD